MVKPVGHPDDGVDNGQNLVSRRQMLAIAGGAGVASGRRLFDCQVGSGGFFQTPSPVSTNTPRRSRRRRWSPGDVGRAAWGATSTAVAVGRRPSPG